MPCDHQVAIISNIDKLKKVLFDVADYDLTYHHCELCMRVFYVLRPKPENELVRLYRRQPDKIDFVQMKLK